MMNKLNDEEAIKHEEVLPDLMEEQEESLQASGSNSDSEGDSSGSDDASSSGTGSSSQSIEAEWGRFMEEDGSLMYIESYVSSTVKERQAHQAIKAASEYESKSPFSSPPKNIKRHTKLLNLLKRRPSVRVKSSSVSDTNKMAGGGNQEPMTSTPKVTFRDNPSGEVRHVILRVTEIGNNFGRRASLSETVLGIMPGRFNEPPDSRVMVAGLVPGSQALRDGSIKIGDWLKEINGVEVDWESLDSILLGIQIPSVVTLSVQKCAVETLPNEDHHSLKRVIQTRLVKFISGKECKSAEWSASVASGTLPLHAVLYLSLIGVTEESPDKADVRYQFPVMTTNKLVQVRGMFLTLAHSLQDVIGVPVVSATVILHGVHYHGVFCREGPDVFLMALPNFCISESDLISVMEQLCRLICFEFGSISSGLANPNNKDYLDHLFLLVLEDLLTLEEGFRPGISHCGGHVPPFTPVVSPFVDYTRTKSRVMLGSPSLLVLRDEFAKIQLEICLTELESGDFGEDDSDCEDCLSLYNIIGCCIFYKNRLALSHLDAESTDCVFQFVDFHRLLHLVESEAVSQLVLWRRVFPPQTKGDSSQTSSVPEREVDHYLLLVAMNHFLLATLVESGNVTMLMDKSAGPDPFLVDQAETTLYQLHSLHIHAACEESLTLSAIETMSLDAKVTASPTRKSSKGKPTYSAEGPPARLPDVPSILKQKSPSHLDSYLDSPSCECEGRSTGEASDDSHSYSPCSKDSPLPEGDSGWEREEKAENKEEESFKDETSSDSDWRVWKSPDGKLSHAHPPEGSFNSKGLPPLPPLRVTVGEENVLLHLVQLNVGEGVIVTSSESDLLPLQFQLLRNFYAAVSHIRHVLHTGRRAKSNSGSYSCSSSLSNTKEYGIMFECSVPSKNKSQDIAYWVVGRSYGPPYEREIYVALEDSITQNLQEIAFRVALGCS